MFRKVHVVTIIGFVTMYTYDTKFHNWVKAEV
jgi:hypothetical protein